VHADRLDAAAMDTDSLDSAAVHADRLDAAAMDSDSLEPAATNSASVCAATTDSGSVHTAAKSDFTGQCSGRGAYDAEDGSGGNRDDSSI
jgi:hypothetical protein